MAAEKVYNVDVCVIGVGTGGHYGCPFRFGTGAVVLLEKMPGLGGGGNFMEGTYAASSRMQIKEYYPYNPEYGFKQIMDFHHWRIDPKLARMFINSTADNIDFLLDHGVEFELIKTMFVRYNLTWHVFKDNTGTTELRCLFQSAGTIS